MACSRSGRDECVLSYGQKRWSERMISKPRSSWKDKEKDFKGTDGGMWTGLIRLDTNAEAGCCAQKRGKDLSDVLATTSFSSMTLLCGYYFFFAILFNGVELFSENGCTHQPKSTVP